MAFPGIVPISQTTPPRRSISYPASCSTGATSIPAHIRFFLFRLGTTFSLSSSLSLSLSGCDASKQVLGHAFNISRLPLHNPLHQTTVSSISSVRIHNDRRSSPRQRSRPSWHASCGAGVLRQDPGLNVCGVAGSDPRYNNVVQHWRVGPASTCCAWSNRRF